MLLVSKRMINIGDVIDNIPAAICIFKCDPGLPVVYYNYLLPRILNYPEERFQHIITGGFMSFLDIDGRKHFNGWARYYLEHPEEEDPIDIVYTVSGGNGERMSFLQRCNFIYSAKGEKLFCCTLTDVTEQQQNERLVNLYSSMDSLTRIFNREMIQKDVASIIVTTKNDFQHIFMMFDIDDFAALNKKVGHDLCDIYLQHFSKVLLQPCKYGKTAGRVGGDEFILLLMGVKEDTVYGAAEEVCRQIQSAFSAFTVSVGISICKNNNTTFDELYKQAFDALQHVKKNGKNGYLFFDNMVNAEEK